MGRTIRRMDLHDAPLRDRTLPVDSRSPEQKPNLHAPGRRHVSGRGTHEARWNDWDRLGTLPLGDEPARFARFEQVWVIAPHPDDEVLALGATLARLAEAGVTLRIVSVTDGEASLPSARRLTAPDLATARTAELRTALDHLGVQARVERLGLPDGQISRDRNTLLHALVDQVGGEDLVLAPCRFDGPSDYEACGETMDLVGQLTGARVWEYPIWMWHWAQPEEAAVPWHRARRMPVSDAALRRKRDAIAAFRTQVMPDVRGEAALPPGVVARFLRPYETIFV
jgi:LmbE family N-acetylglucosaminyl deacetylase